MAKKNLVENYLNKILKEEEKETTEIDVENPGLLEVPEGKEVDKLPIDHFKKLVDKKGWAAISRGLTNLKVWNKQNNPSLSSWANSMHNKLSKWWESKN